MLLLNSSRSLLWSLCSPTNGLLYVCGDLTSEDSAELASGIFHAVPSWALGRRLLVPRAEGEVEIGQGPITVCSGLSSSGSVSLPYLPRHDVESPSAALMSHLELGIQRRMLSDSSLTSTLVLVSCYLDPVAGASHLFQDSGWSPLLWIGLFLCVPNSALAQSWLFIRSIRNVPTSVFLFRLDEGHQSWSLHVHSRQQRHHSLPAH